MIKVLLLSVLLLFAPVVSAQEFITNTPIVTEEPTEVAPVEATPIPVEETPIEEVPIEEAPVDAPIGPDDNLTEAGVTIIATVTGYLEKFIASVPAFAVIVAFLVGLLKYTPLGYKADRQGWKGLHSSTLTFAVSALLWLTYTLSERVGLAGAYLSLSEQIAALAPYILGFVGTLFGARYVHEQAAARGVAVIGAKRTPIAASASAGGPGLSYTISPPPVRQTIAFGQDAAA